MSSSEEDEEYLEESSHSDGEDSEEGSDSDGFELQESSDEEEGLVEGGDSDDEEEKQGEMVTRREEKRAVTRSWKASVRDKAAGFTSSSGKTDPNGDVYSNLMDADDLSSDDEAGEKNTIGRVPLHWYDAYDHIGYDITGAKVEKRKGKDRMDQAIANRDDPAARRTIYDMYNDQEVVLSERDMEIIRRMQAGAFAHPEHDDTPDYSAYFSSIEEIMPMSAAPLEKRNFTPSKWETMRVMKIMNAMKEGRYKTSAQVRDIRGLLCLCLEDYCSIKLLSDSISSGALGSPDLLLPYSMISIALHNTIILIITYLAIPKSLLFSQHR